MPRRSFLRQAALTGAVVGAHTAGATRIGAEQTAPREVKAEDTLRSGIAGYTFLKFKLEPALEMTRKVDVHYFCIKDFHLPLNSTDEQIAAFHAKCQSCGVTGYGVGPIYMGTAEEVDKAFAYARRVGVKTLVGIPFEQRDKKRVASRELLKLVHEKVQESDIRYAIHNHGPDMPELFPTAESVMELIGGLDKRIGLCLDIGHEFRAGKDPIQVASLFAERLYDVHLKNVTAPDKAGRTTELPRGAIDLLEFTRVLRKIRYAGVCSLEYEKEMDNPLPGIAECVGYFRGLMDATRPAV